MMPTHDFGFNQQMAQRPNFAPDFGMPLGPMFAQQNFQPIMPQQMNAGFGNLNIYIPHYAGKAMLPPRRAGEGPTFVNPKQAIRIQKMRQKKTERLRKLSMQQGYGAVLAHATF
jgi:hypothetical protein